MSGLATDLVYCVYLAAPPAVAALSIAWLGNRFLPGEAPSRWALAAGVAVGVLLGYVLLPEWAPLAPARYWQWLPYLAIAAAIVGAVSTHDAIRPWERLLAAAVLTVVAAQAIVPTWDTLQPPRTTLVPLVAAYLLLLFSLLVALPQVLIGRTFTLLLALATLGTAAIVGYEVSAKLGQLGAIFAAAMLGASAWMLIPRKSADAEATVAIHARSNRSLSLVYAIGIGGLAFAAMIEPTEPALPLLVAPAAPLALWLFAVGPLSQLRGWAAIALKTLAVFLVLAALVGWLLLRSEPVGDEWSHLPSANPSWLTASIAKTPHPTSDRTYIPPAPGAQLA